MSKQNYKFIISGGGTGGHIFPALAIANEIKRRYPNSEFLFVGAKGRMEMSKVPQAGYDIEGLWISGLQRKLTLKNLSFPFKLISSMMDAKKIIKKFRPDYVIGTGGYASGPTLRAAQSAGVPTMIQEQNSYPGITNKLLAPRVDHICVAYENMDKFFPKEKIIYTGNPIRNEVIQIEGKKEEAVRYFTLSGDKKTILLVGGSQGALSVNKAIAENIEFFKREDIQFVWQTGSLYYEQALEVSKSFSNVRVVEFINRMDLAYSIADLVVSRAGAMAISELCAVAKPVIFIPLPSAAEDHQTKNAQSIAKNNAAVVIHNSEVVDKIVPEIERLFEHSVLMDEMSLNISKYSVEDAASRIVNQIEKNLGIK
jgi:UDP-N-acetylglucosamine--N-acetylmuramyl-(pentapeptide) pyrophosphoryl-undecaprenol N-acetylglucosamine transferase